LIGTWAADVDIGVFHGPLALRIGTKSTGALGARLYAPAYWTDRPNGGGVSIRRDGQRVEFGLHDLSAPHPGGLFPFGYFRGPWRWTYIGAISADGSVIRGDWIQDGENENAPVFARPVRT
jgi:hypothetical protein